MTVEEAYQQFGGKSYIATEGDNIIFLARKIYSSDEDVYQNVLKVLNPRVNWIHIPVGTEILYLDSSVITQYLY